MHNAHSLPYSKHYPSTALHYTPQNYSTFFAAWSKIYHNFPTLPVLCTTIVHQLLYRFTPYLPCTMRIHSPTTNSTHLLHCTTPLKIIQLFLRLGRKFTTILLHSPSFALPLCTNYSTDLLHICHAQCAFTPLQQILPIYCTALHPSKLFNFFRGLVENLPQFDYTPHSLHYHCAQTTLPIYSIFAMHNAHSLPYNKYYPSTALHYTPQN